MKISVPGNLLLLGEYAIVEPGGLGVAIAIDKYVVGRCTPAEQFSIIGIMGPEVISWTTMQQEHSALFSAIYEACRLMLSQYGVVKDFPACTITVDASAFFAADGRKLGFGSSAASTVALAFLLCSSVCDELPQAASIAYRAAIIGHRAFQGGKGSGYDVAASFYGGCGLFTGGELPLWNQIKQDWLFPLFLVHGKNPVSSAKAVLGYTEWKKRYPELFDKFIAVSNRVVNRFSKARSAKEAAACFALARRCSVWIGKQLSVDAEPKALSQQLVKLRNCGFAAKASGAGGEMGIAFLAKNEYNNLTPAYAKKVMISEKGLQWEL